MRFATAHKKAKLDPKRPNDPFGAHRNRNVVWVTSNYNTVMSHTFSTVRKAKAWMNAPTLNISKG